MEEIFYEDILETFLFCFFAALGIMQIMVARRGWHGLSVYGGRVRANVNQALGTALLIFAFAWYFSDPLHRNVRNIEAFMSIVCLVLGIAAAASATALLSSLSEWLRRLRRRRAGRSRGAAVPLETLQTPAGKALASRSWGERGENLVVIAEPGRGPQDLVRELYAALPQGHGLLSLHPHYPAPGRTPSSCAADSDAAIMEALASAERARGVCLEGEVFLGLGWGGNALLLRRSEVEERYSPRRLLAAAPVVPDCEQGTVGDAFLSNTPLDVCAVLADRKPWRDPSFMPLLRLWLPVFALCVAAATALTVGFDVRWKFFSGPAAGLLLSLWGAYFVARRRGRGGEEGQEQRLASRLCAPSPQAGSAAPLVMVLAADDGSRMEAMPAQTRLSYQPCSIEVWRDVLRGKFTLDGGTIPRLAALIREGWGESSERTGNSR